MNNLRLERFVFRLFVLSIFRGEKIVAIFSTANPKAERLFNFTYLKKTEFFNSEYGQYTHSAQEGVLFPV
jgi:hypothetical protein